MRWITFCFSRAHEIDTSRNIVFRGELTEATAHRAAINKPRLSFLWFGTPHLVTASSAANRSATTHTEGRLVGTICIQDFWRYKAKLLATTLGGETSIGGHALILRHIGERISDKLPVQISYLVIGWRFKNCPALASNVNFF